MIGDEDGVIKIGEIKKKKKIFAKRIRVERSNFQKLLRRLTSKFQSFKNAEFTFSQVLTNGSLKKSFGADAFYSFCHAQV